MSASILPALQSSAEKKTKSGTSAERVVWMTRTSDVHGSHIKTDLDSYMTLIRRKIQEKCATTAELITQIRRFKVGDSGNVTPNEFRFTLIKFGLTFPQTLVDKIFNVFDSDRSGTMDFDEFAMWIMNSEFRPAVQASNGKREDTPRTMLRKKLQEIVNSNRRTFTNMKKQISFLEFVADIHRMQFPLTDYEARSVFLVLDPDATGFIKSQALICWADTGKVLPNVMDVQAPAEISAKNLEELVAKVVGRNTAQLESAFSHIRRGDGTRIPFDELRRCLLNAGVGKKVHECRQLFMALGGADTGEADVDLLFNKLAPMIVDPATAVSAKKVATSEISASRADRRLRDALRKSFKIVRGDIEALDAQETGFIEQQQLYKILVKRCTPLTFQDFRFILQQIRKEPGGTRIDYNHFLHGYNPLIAPHALLGSATIKSYDPEQHHSATAGSMRVSTAGLSSTLPSRSSVGATGLNKSKTMDELDLRMAAAAASKSLRASSSKADGSRAGSGVGSDVLARKVWQSVLRECHRADPERSGQVSRNVFISALEKGNLDKSMTPESMNALADQYTLSSGLVHYLQLFRTYLNDLTTTQRMRKSQSLSLMDSADSGAAGKHGELKPLHPWDYDYKRDKHQPPYWKDANQHPKDIEGEIERKSKQLQSVPDPHEKSIDKLSSTEKSALLSQYSPKVLGICAKSYGFFAQGDKLRALRNSLKKVQVPTQRGCALTSNFLSVIEEHGIVLSKAELSVVVRVFRGLGMQDVVKYDEFIRVSALAGQQM